MRKLFDFHGWITIQESTSEVDEGNLESIVQDLKEHIAGLEWNQSMLQLHAVNGSYRIIIDGLTNRKSKEAHDIIELLEQIGKVAPGSYGLIHLRDDENLQGLDNEFKVLVLARGKVNVKKDTFLSPCIPIIEDER